MCLRLQEAHAEGELFRDVDVLVLGNKRAEEGRIMSANKSYIAVSAGAERVLAVAGGVGDCRESEDRREKGTFK